MKRELNSCSCRSCETPSRSRRLPQRKSAVGAEFDHFRPQTWASRLHLIMRNNMSKLYGINKAHLNKINILLRIASEALIRNIIHEICACEAHKSKSDGSDSPRFTCRKVGFQPELKLVKLYV
ncbi:hypothetical protein TorRG33x02_290650 [Trema orientale]|uniref:Uncharacterized protein n=1 Tax=Trema orientale TaxID=63057 RepID=A0A2P5CBZ5_TREOI|nr:hypothetical protein TorRG33x02_290650 [Trema orientale]